MRFNDRIYVAGHTGLVGSAIMEALKGEGFQDLIYASHSELDLNSKDDVQLFFHREKPRHVILAAARVGGIGANIRESASFIEENLRIQTNVIDVAARAGCEKFLFFGSSCIYPKKAKEPITEDQIFNGRAEPTNAAYAVAKRAGIGMCETYGKFYPQFKPLVLVPCNLFGPRDNFDRDRGHLVPAVMRKMHEAKIARSDQVILWGSGKPRRELLYAPDLAEVAVQLLSSCEFLDPCPIINVSPGEDAPVSEIAKVIQEIVQFKGQVFYDPEKPDGIMSKKTSNEALKSIHPFARWSPTPIEEALDKTYRWFLENET